MAGDQGGGCDGSPQWRIVTVTCGGGLRRQSAEADCDYNPQNEIASEIPLPAGSVFSSL